MYRVEVEWKDTYTTTIKCFIFLFYIVFYFLKDILSDKLWDLFGWPENIFNWLETCVRSFYLFIWFSLTRSTKKNKMNKLFSNDFFMYKLENSYTWYIDIYCMTVVIILWKQKKLVVILFYGKNENQNDFKIKKVNWFNWLNEKKLSIFNQNSLKMRTYIVLKQQKNIIQNFQIQLDF